jgi:hypothetical protein
MPTWRSAVDGHDTARYVFGAAWSVAGFVPVCGPVLAGRSAHTLWLGIPFLLIWQLGLWRTVLVGVYVSDHGIKIRSLFRTRVIPWARVDRVWTGQADGYDAWQIWVTTRDPERHLPTPIWRRGSSAFHVNRIVLPVDQFTAVLTAVDPAARTRS